MRGPSGLSVLRPNSDTGLVRARVRVGESPQHRNALTDEGRPIRHIRDHCRHLGPIEQCVIDSSALDPRAMAMLIGKRMAALDLGFPAVDAQRRSRGRRP